MNTRIHFLALLLLMQVPMRAQPVHPRLFFGGDDIPALRQKITKEPWKSMYQKLLADRNKNGGASVELGTGTPAGEYDQSVVAQRHAFLYVLTGDEAYAQRARDMVNLRINDATGDNAWGTDNARGLNMYWHGSRVSLAFDWCYKSAAWQARVSQTNAKPFRQLVSEKLLLHGNAIYTSGGYNQSKDAASNWQGGRFGSGGLCLLATDQAVAPADLHDCYDKVVLFLRSNFGTSSESRGWNIEGLGYNYFPMGNYVGPFGIAMRRADPQRDIRTACEGALWTYWTTFAATTAAFASDGTGIRPDFGDDNPGTAGEGVYGQAFYYSPEELKPGLLHVYDRLWGAQGNQSYDPSRGGTIYSILYHPGDTLAAEDPMSIDKWRDGFVDTGGNGFFTWRNRYRDKDDMVSQLYVKLRGNRGHNGPDALSFRIIGLDTPFTVGGGRDTPGRWQGQNTLYPVSPSTVTSVNSISSLSGSIAAPPVSKRDGGGHLVSEISTNNLGVNDHKRRFIADHSPASGAAAVYVISDSSTNGQYWQLNTVENNLITTSGNTFTVHGAGGNTMRGTILYPTSNFRFSVGTRPRGSNYSSYANNNFVHFQSDDGCYLVVLTCIRAGQSHPVVSATGSWAGPSPVGTVTAGNLSVHLNGDAVTYPWSMAQFTRTYFGSAQPPSALSAPDADPDGDGIRNLMEYALGGNPLEADQATITPALAEQDYLTLTFTRPIGRTDAAFYLRSSGNLQNWETLTEEQARVTKTLNRDATETIKLRDAVPAGKGPRFLQLQVTKP